MSCPLISPDLLEREVIQPGLCVGCGACVALAPPESASMERTSSGLQPRFAPGTLLPLLAWTACPGKGIDYPKLYESYYGSHPHDWRVGHVDHLWTGHATSPDIRRRGASGGVITAVLLHLLESGNIDGAVLVRQGIPTPEQASWYLARTAEEIIRCAQSVYIPVSILDALPHLPEGQTFAMTCVPEQAAALRVLQQAGHPTACQIRYVLGPYTGTSLDPRAIRALLRSHRVPDTDGITSLQWRAGEWPGHLEIHTESNRTIRSKKVYYNFLIPFYITQTSLQSMDFANEFCDLSVGDAWSPRFEALGQGFSVVASRTESMTRVISEMQDLGLLTLDPCDPLDASAMHGHMIDFKKRGAYLRNRWREATFRKAPDIGLEPSPLGFSRIAAEIIIIALFGLCRTAPARWLMERIPERVLGPLFNQLRLAWKHASKPAKRKGLANLVMRDYPPSWQETPHGRA